MSVVAKMCFKHFRRSGVYRKNVTMYDRNSNEPMPFTMTTVSTRVSIPYSSHKLHLHFKNKVVRWQRSHYIYIHYVQTYDRNPLTNGNIDDSPVDCFLMYLKHTSLNGMKILRNHFLLRFNQFSARLTYDPVKICRTDVTIAVTETMSNQVTVDICLFYSPIRCETYNHFQW